MRFTVLSLIALVVCLRAVPAEACSIVGPTPLQIDPTLKATDTTPPTLTVAALTGVKRGQGRQSDGCSSTASSCDDLGWINVAVQGTDDMTMSQELGFRVALVAGTPPAGLTIPEGATTGFVSLLWIDGNTDDQEAFDFTLAIVAVDRAGNESAPKTVHIVSEGSGCSVASPAPPRGMLAFALVTLVALGVRRRSRSQADARS
jgi:MYXO-CTERM domain-containing protein